MGRTRKTLHLDRENRKFLGVCAGVANFLEVEASTVRIVYFVGCIFGGWFLIPLYFIAWFLLDDNSASMRSSLTDNMMVNHFKNVDYRKKLYRNTRDKKVFGVCAGIADYLEVNVFAVRMFALVMVFMSGFPFLLYLGAALILDPKPDHLYDVEPDAYAPRQRADAQAGAASGRRVDGHDPRDELRGDKYSKRREFQFCVRKFTALHERLARMEAYVTSSRFKLHREFRNIS
ncbi:MAG: PspC domain-containing protein [Pseudomonadota bacterium]|nr:PspC domain-containing protein [Pseudomonadota bacterium]